MKKITSAGFLSITLLMLLSLNRSHNVNKKVLNNNITYTTLDVKQNYNVIKVITGYVETASPSKEPFINAYEDA